MVYDTEHEVAYCLNSVAGDVLLACDGQSSKEVVIGQLGDSAHAADLLETTLTELQERGLLKASPREGFSRRSFLARWGAVAAALPIIASIQAPQEAHAQSGSPTTPGFRTTIAF